MFEMRYVVYPVDVGASCNEIVTKLQYRTMTNIMEIGIQEPIWSEWIDVPTVIE